MAASRLSLGAASLMRLASHRFRAVLSTSAVLAGPDKVLSSISVGFRAQNYRQKVLAGLLFNCVWIIVHRVGCALCNLHLDILGSFLKQHQAITD